MLRLLLIGLVTLFPMEAMAKEKIECTASVIVQNSFINTGDGKTEEDVKRDLEKIAHDYNEVKNEIAF